MHDDGVFNDCQLSDQEFDDEIVSIDSQTDGMDYNDLNDILDCQLNSKENDDNNNNILKGVNQTLDLLENKIDEVSGIDNEIVFEEKKDYKTFSEKFKVGK